MNKRGSNRAVKSLAVVLGLLALPAILAAQTVTVLHSFSGTDGQAPDGRSLKALTEISMEPRFQGRETLCPEPFFE